MIRNIRIFLLWIHIVYVSAGTGITQDDFYAYYTKVQHTSTDYFGKYADLIVSLGEGKQLEFTRRTQYVPRWVTFEGSYLVDEFFPERDMDYSFDYNYVRLLEESPEKIVVHWRYVPDIEFMEYANMKQEPTIMEGFTNVVHELFTIYPTGKIDRVVKEARETVYDVWINEDMAHRQTLQLNTDGISHGRVIWGNQERELPEPVAKNPIIRASKLPEPDIYFRFDEGGGDFPDFEEEELEEIYEEILENAIDYANIEIVFITGHGAVYKKGVSGTALAFDGYYTGISYEEELPGMSDEISVEAWLALDVYPYNNAPLVHKSKDFGEYGFYLGVNPYGKPFIKVNGSESRSENVIPLYTWTHVAATIDSNTAILYVDGMKVAETNFKGKINLKSLPLTIGINTQKERCTDYVRDFDQNIPFIYGIQGLLDEVKVYNRILSEKEISAIYSAFLPEERKSDLEKALLPGEVGVAEKFGATYKTLSHHELWDRMWRLTEYSDILVKFDNNPASIVYWHGTNYAANYVTDNNRWMADQSSEIFTKHGCSEHMADKQCRHSYARVIENSDARVMIHWRYPCVDVGYVCTDKRNWTDEYHTIYPDGTAIRKVVFNNDEQPGFQDIQFFTNPGETALDVVHMNAMTVANTKGEILELEWKKPNKNPEQKLKDATIEWLNSKSEYKVFAIYQGGEITTWGEFEQSRYTDDPFAGPWNHWPVSLVPSDGRFAVAHDRVTHFALGANDPAPIHGAMVHYGFTNNKIDALIPLARYWQNPPIVTKVAGGKSKGFIKEEKAYYFDSIDSETLSFNIDANSDSPVVNPVLVLQNCNAQNPEIKINGKFLEPGDSLRTGREYDVNGKPKTIIWMNYTTNQPVQIEIMGL
jgi:hypothetical protein